MFVSTIDIELLQYINARARNPTSTTKESDISLFGSFVFYGNHVFYKFCIIALN